MQKPPKQKQATRGQRQIYEENRSTFFTYLCASLASTILVTALDIFAFKTTNADWFGLIISAIFEFTAVTFMFIMSKNVRNEKNQVVDAGLDLNDPEAFGEYCKDIVILSVIVQLLGLISAYFYLILLIVPGYAAFKLWTKLLAPWFFAPAPEVDRDESNKRKQKKKEKTVYLRR